MEQIQILRKGINKILKGANEIMDAFIEVTEKFDGIKVCLPLKEIKSLSVDKDGNTFIETGKDADGQPTGVYCKDAYSQIMLKLIKFIL